MLDLKNNEPKVKERGSICIRRGITASCPGGTGWEFVIGVILLTITTTTHIQSFHKKLLYNSSSILQGGWSFVCNRGHDIPY